MDKSFTPNMTKKQIMEQDRKRGMPNEDPMDTFPKDDHPTDKKTGLNAAKAIEDLLPGEDVSKPLPKKNKRKGESEFQHKIRQWTDEVKERPGRFPGGHKQAVAIAAQQAGVSKGLDILKAYLGNKDVMVYGEDKKNDVEGLFDETSKASYEEEGPDLAKMGGMPMGGIQDTPGVETMKAKDSENELETEADELEIEVDELEVEPKKMKIEMDKALSSKNFPVLRPRPTDDYNPTQIQRSATTATTRAHSALAPAVRDTMENVVEDEKKKFWGTTYKSCNSHGLPYLEERGCNMCKSSDMANMLCKDCGYQMKKMVGGYRCGTCEGDE